MKKRIFKTAVLMISLITLVTSVLTGCNKPVDSNFATESPESTSNSEELKHEKISWYLRFAEQKDTNTVLEEINKRLNEKINAELEIIRVDAGVYNEKLKLAVAAGEKFDICFTSPAYGFYDNVAKGAFLEIDDLLKKYAPKSYEQIPASFWSATKIKDKIYGFINYQIVARQYGFIIQKDMVDKYNIDVNSIKKVDDIEPYLEKMKAGESSDKIVFDLYKMGKFVDLENYYRFEDIGAQNSSGVLKIDGGLKVVNQFESPEFKNHVETMRRWNEKGFFMKDVATATNFKEVRATGKILAAISNMKPGDEIELKNLFKNEMVKVPLDEPYVSTNNIIATMQAISRTSENPERAMMMLELFNTDKELYNLLCFGIEGTHYTIDSENRVVSNKDAGYAPNAAWMFGNQFNAYLQPGQVDTVWDDTKKLNESAEVSKLIGFVFNPEPVKIELAQCKTVVDEFTAGLWTGSVDPDVYLPQFIEKLKTAGAGKVISEKQRQIDEWSKK